MSSWKTKALLLHRYATVLLLNPAMGGLLVCSVVVAMGAILFWPKVAKHEVVSRKLMGVPLAAPIVHAAVVPVAAPHIATPRPVSALQKPAVEKPTVFNSAAFDSATMNAMLQPIDRFAGMPAKELMRHISVHDMINAVVPYAPFHYGVDYPLSTLMGAFFLRSDIPVEVHESRYLLMSQTNAATGGRGSEFLWVDTRNGVGIGGIFFYPTNGEPSPTLTLFSQQVKGHQINIQQMPAEFLRELRVWQEKRHLPPLTVRYFVNAQGEKTVLLHTEDFCAGDAVEGCKKMNVDAVELDAEANYFLGQTHYASNATQRMIGNSE